MTSSAIDRLMSYDWPGNVRKLENAVERAMILSRGRPLTFRDIELETDLFHCSSSPDEIKNSLSGTQMAYQRLDRMIAGHIVKALKMAGGQVGGKGGAAELLGVNPSTLRKKMKKLGIPFGKSASTNYKAQF
jgi:DNA-binding NtrC family response regulator